MCTNADTLTNKMPELKASVDHYNPWIIAITEMIPKNYRIPVQKAELKISNNYDIFPESISSKGRGHNCPSTQKSEGTRNSSKN